MEVTETQESYHYLQAQFSHHSQRALGSYSSLQLTLKTIAQTTALRQKEVNYTYGCYVILEAFFPIIIPSAFGEASKFRKAFVALFFSFLFSFFKTDSTDQHSAPFFECHN